MASREIILMEIFKRRHMVWCMVYGVWCMVCTVCQCPPYIPPMRLEDMCSHPHHCTTAQAQCIHCIHCVHCVSLLCSGGGGDLVRYWFCDMRVRSWLWFAVYCSTILYNTIVYYTVLYYTVLHFTVLYYTTLYYTIPYATILFCTVIDCITLYCTLP